MHRARFEGLRDRFPRLHRLLTSEDKPYPVLREVAVGAVLVLLVLGTLWGYTGQPLGDSPVVVVESGSMMHCKNHPAPASTEGRGCQPTRYGRLGTIDPGDLILVKDVDARNDVQCQAERGEDHYGRDGDVIIFHRDGRKDTPIIHRCLFWLEMHADGTFSVPALGLDHERELDQQEVVGLTGVSNYAQTMRDPAFDGVCGPVGPARSGFITRGDNNAAGADQNPTNPGSVATCPVKVAWTLGVARGEIPWIGLVKLLANDLVGGSSDFAAAGTDSKVLLVVSLGVLLGGPVVLEKTRAMRRQRREADDDDGSPPH